MSGKSETLLGTTFLRIGQLAENRGLDEQDALTRAWRILEDAGIDDIPLPKLKLPIYHSSHETRVGDMVLLTRTIRGISQLTLSQRSDLHKNTIQAIETFKRRASEETIRKLAGGLEVRVGFLFGEDFSPAEDVITSLLKDLKNPANREVGRHIIKTLIKDIQRGYVYLSLLKPELVKNTP